MSLTYKQALAAMYGYFETNKPTGTIVIWGNDDPTDIPDDAIWTRFNVRHSTGFQSTMGDPSNNRFERRGIITIQIFQPGSQYGVGAENLASDILDLYAGLTNSDIHYFDAFVREVGNDGNGWYQVNVITSFRYDQLT